MSEPESPARFLGAHARGSSWSEAVDECVRQLGAAHDLPLAGGSNEDGFEYLGFVFVTDLAAENLGQIETRLRGATGVNQWSGTVGLGVCGTAREYFDEPAAAILIARLPAGSFRVFEHGANDGTDPGTRFRFPDRVEDSLGSSPDAGGARAQDSPSDAIGARTPDWYDGAGPAFAFVHADPQAPGLPDRLDELSRQVATGFLVGGLASSRGAVGMLANGSVAGSAVTGVLLDSSIGLSTRLSQGCVPIGPRHEITRCQQHLLIELDGRPALDVFREDIGEVLSRDLNRVGGLIFAGLPISGSDTGDYLVRNLVGLDPGNGIVAIGELVTQGDTVMFCRRDAESASEDLRRMLRELAASLDGPPAGGLYYTCLARGPNLFGPDSAELRIIEEELGSFPLAGFFGNGEISHDRLYAYTGVLTLFK